MGKIKAGLVAASLAMLAAGAAQATPVFSLGQSDVYFNNYENLYRATASCVGNACLAASAGDPVGFLRVNQALAGNVQFNDVFVGILTAQNVVTTALGTNSYDSLPGDRFTGYFAQKVIGITGTASAAVVQLGTTVDPFGILGAGEMFRFYSNTSNFSSTGTVGSGIALATSGNFWASFGIGTEGYFESRTDLTVPVTNSNTQAFFGLDIINIGSTYSAGALSKVNDFNESDHGTIANPGNLVCSAAEIANPAISCTDIVGNSKIQQNGSFNAAGGSGSPWQFQSNDPYSLVRIPEPGTLALVGLSLTALSVSRRRKSK